VNVKIPVTNTKGDFAGPVIRSLSSAGITVNITAVFTDDQVCDIADALDPDAPAIVSVFAGRIADTGVDPAPFMQMCKWFLRCRPKAQLLWASTRELFSIFQADECGCDIITVPPEILGKLDLVGKDLAEYSRETVLEFYRNATGLTIWSA
jgi:transaldolase